MFNHQKTLARQLLVKLQGQALTSHFVLNTLLDEFSNMDSIYGSYKPTIPSAVQLLKLSQKTCHHLETHDPFTLLRDTLKWLTGTATMRDTWEIKQCINQLIQE